MKRNIILSILPYAVLGVWCSIVYAGHVAGGGAPIVGGSGSGSGGGALPAGSVNQVQYKALYAYD
jgi:hypothetical protein